MALEAFRAAEQQHPIALPELTDDADDQLA
jgi:hypothetical protein